MIRHSEPSRLANAVMITMAIAALFAVPLYAKEAAIQSVLDSGELDAQYAGAGRQLIPVPRGVTAEIVDADMRSQNSLTSSLVKLVDNNANGSPTYWIYVHTAEGKPLLSAGAGGRFQVQLLDKAHAFLDTGSYYLIVGQANGRPAVAAYGPNGQPLTEFGNQGRFIVGSFPASEGTYVEGSFTSIDSELRLAGYRTFEPLLPGSDCTLQPRKSLAFVTALSLSDDSAGLIQISPAVTDIRPDAYHSHYFSNQENVIEVGADDAPCSRVEESIKITRIGKPGRLYAIVNRKVTVPHNVLQWGTPGAVLNGYEGSGFTTTLRSSIIADPGMMQEVTFDPMQLHDGLPPHMLYTATKDSYDNEGEMGVPRNPRLLIAGYDPSSPEFTVFRTRIVADRSGRYVAKLVPNFAQDGVLRLPGFDPRNAQLGAPAYPSDMTGRFDTPNVILAGRFDVGTLSRTAATKFSEHTGIVDTAFGQNGWYVSKNTCPNDQDRAVHVRYFWHQSYYLFGSWMPGACVQEADPGIQKTNPVLTPKPPYFLPKGLRDRG